MASRLPPSSAPGPLSGGQWIAAVLGVVVVVSAVVLGFVVFFVLLLAGFAAWLAFSIRSWWHARKGVGPGAPGQSSRGGDTLEGEFEVLGGKQGSRDRGTDHE